MSDDDVTPAVPDAPDVADRPDLPAAAVAPVAAVAAPTVGRRSRKRAAEEAAREANEARSREKMRRYGLPALVVIVVLVLILGVVKLVGGGGSHKPGASAAVRTQRTLLLQLVPAVGDASVGNALTAADSASDNGVFLALPGRLITDVPGRGRTTFDQTSLTADGTIAGQAITDELGVLVDASWVMTQPAMAALIDKVGGVVVDVDVDVTMAQGASTVVVVPKGQAQKLNGAQAVAYASFLAPSEAEQARMTRFTTVWQALLAALPADADSIRNLITGSAGSVSTWPPQTLAAYLADLHAAVNANSVAYPPLPTVVVDGAGGRTTYRLDAAKSQALIKQQFAGSLPPVRPGGPVTVLVQNGVGTPGLSEKARAKLIAAGLTYQGGGNAARFGYTSSVVLIKDATLASRQQGAAVATALGLPATAVQQAKQVQSVADVLVILGADFRG